jgi:hypothetical protein
MFHTRGEHQLELGLGLSAMHWREKWLDDNNEWQQSGPDWRLFAALAVGYRQQPRQKRVFFRTGAAWVYGLGLPGQVSLGRGF